MSGETLLELRGLSVFYGPVEAVHQVQLNVQAGEIVTVIGPNGASKTTLLSAAMGLLPSKGRSGWMASVLPSPRWKAWFPGGWA